MVKSHSKHKIGTEIDNGIVDNYLEYCNNDPTILTISEIEKITSLPQSTIRRFIKENINNGRCKLFGRKRVMCMDGVIRAMPAYKFPKHIRCRP